jgi:glutamate formiminotransferase
MASEGPLIELVPNVSTADPAVVAALAAAMREAGAFVLDTSSDRWHNRSVITAAAAPEHAVPAVLALVSAAAQRIDIRQHHGVHPRIGAVDVVPFVPLRHVTMDDCTALARRCAAEVAAAYDVPVYLYERAATRADRVTLADIRRGGWEQLRETIASDPYRAPDAGPARTHPTLGAVAIGARDFLVAFNVFIGPADQLPAARRIARAVRESSGGVPGLKAIAVAVNGQAQVSMNLVDLSRITLAQAYEAVAALARADGLTTLRGELIGLVPTAQCTEDTAQIPGLASLASNVIDQRLRQAAP